MKVVLAVAAVLVAAAFAAQAGAAAPGPKCGGTLWKQMTLADNGKSVNWNPTVTTIPEIAKLAAPGRVTASRTTSFQKRVWKLNDVVIERYRVASSGELVFELFDIPSSTYMNAYIPAPSCMTANKTLRKAMFGARNGFVKNCPAATGDWPMLGSHAVPFGVWFWN